MYKVFGLRGYL